MPYSRQVKLEELERELNMRKRVYPRWIKEGRIAEVDAFHRLNVLREIVEDYETEPELFDD